MPPDFQSVPLPGGFRGTRVADKHACRRRYGWRRHPISASMGTVRMGLGRPRHGGRPVREEMEAVLSSLEWAVAAVRKSARQIYSMARRYGRLRTTRSTTLHYNHQRPHGIDRDPLLATCHAASGSGALISAAYEFSDARCRPCVETRWATRRGHALRHLGALAGARARVHAGP
jgi:hypothetical protein